MTKEIIKDRKGQEEPPIIPDTEVFDAIVEEIEKVIDPKKDNGEVNKQK